jgi:hypothetical protein
LAAVFFKPANRAEKKTAPKKTTARKRASKAEKFESGILVQGLESGALERNN